MVEKVPAFRANSGKLFLSEEAAVRSEAIERLCEIIPEFALIRPRIESNLDAISQATASLVSFKAKNHPEPAPENHPADHGELAGLCDCSAGMNGASDHHPSCPAWKPTVFKPSDKPRLAVPHG